MVLTLRQVCLMQICNNIMDDEPQGDLETVSPLIHRQIFSTLAGREQLSNPNCLKYMKGLLCDDSLCAIDTLPIHERFHLLRYNTYSGFLQFLNEHFQSFPDVADRITTLRFAAINEEPTRGHLAFDSSQADLELPTDLRTVLQLISRCRNLRNLLLITCHPEDIDAPHFMELLSDAVRHAKSSGLETLELTHHLFNKREFSPSPDQRLAFAQLKRVRFESVSMTEKGYGEFLDCCRNTLECLVLDELVMDTGDSVPLRLDELTSLEVCKGRMLNLTDLAERCPKLRSCHFDLRQSDLNSETISAVKSLMKSFDGDCSITLAIQLNLSPIANTLIDLAGDRVTELHMQFDADWTEDAVRRVIVGCPNLRTLGASDYMSRASNPVLESFLIVIFCNKERAERLLELDLLTGMSDHVLDLLFKNCVNLEKLRLHGPNARPTDEHLETWIERGARPLSVRFQASRITDRGLKRLITICGFNLNSLEVNCHLEDANSVVELLINCCPRLECVSIPDVSEQIRDSYSRCSRKFFARIPY